MTKVTWSQLKSLIDINTLICTWHQDDNSYTVSAWNGPEKWTALITITNPASSEQTDFETNYKPNGNKKLIPDTDPYANTNLFKAACLGFAGTATAGQTTNIDYTLSDTRYLVGVAVIVKNQVFGDKITLQIVHPQAGVVNEFATDWNLSDDAQDQGKVEFPLRGKLDAGLKVRLVYTSVGIINVSVGCNLILHKKNV